MSAITTLYDDIRAIIINTRNTIYKAVNTGILEANWKIGRRIVEEEQAGASRAEYGQRVINDLAEKLSVEFGRGFDARELRRYRQFYLLFPKWDALRPELTWTHYRTFVTGQEPRISRPDCSSVTFEWGLFCQNKQPSCISYPKYRKINRFHQKIYTIFSIYPLAELK